MIRLLIVDDEAIIRESLAQMVKWETIGYELIGTATNGMDAFDIIRDEYPDVVLTDIRMPVLDGLELIERAHALDAGIHFILLSGYGDFEYARKAMAHGVRHYLLKPTNRQQVLEALAEIREDTLRRRQLVARQDQLRVDNVMSVLRKCFLLEALHCQGSQEQLLVQYRELADKYRHVLPAAIHATEEVQLLTCEGLDEGCLPQMLKDARRFLDDYEEDPLLFPVLYVHGSALMMTRFSRLFELNRFLAHLSTVRCRTGNTQQLRISHLDIRIDRFSDFTRCFAAVVPMVRRHGRILLGNGVQSVQEISNSVAIMALDCWADRVRSACCESELDEVLSEALASAEDLSHAIAFAIGLSMQLQVRAADQTERARLMQARFVEDLGRCDAIRSVATLTRSYLMGLSGQTDPETCMVKNSMERLCHYIDAHLHEEHLSLKWIAENHLYVSVGYLSKLFAREVGERFSEYLNRRRMERARELLRTKHTISVREVAEAVGFGSNPRYFGQVFKKYVGQTPSDYVTEIAQEIAQEISQEVVQEIAQGV